MMPVLEWQSSSTTNNSAKMFVCHFFARSVGRSEAAEVAFDSTGVVGGGRRQTTNEDS